ncbi:MAG: low-specificity L-threonine aldolase [Acidimicrobiales bacterium]
MIDLRSDTVTAPTPAMREAMAAAAVGDDVFGDDPTVIRLEGTVAELLGLPAAVFVPSGTQSNLCALLAHAQRGDEYLVGEGAHCFRFEAGGAAVLGSIQPQPVREGPDGRLDLAHAESVVKPDDVHFARTRLLCLENTRDGQVLPLGHHAEAQALARRHGLGLHLDGARLWNAAVALGEEPAAVAAGFDTVSVCLSKGLGAPVGSVLAGRADLIASARRWRKMLGGGMRQAGVLAAAGLVALDHRHRLVDDHHNAARLAEGLAALAGVTVARTATNMVFVRFPAASVPALTSAYAAAGVRVLLNRRPGGETRLVTHRDVTGDDVATVIAITAAALRPG